VKVLQGNELENGPADHCAGRSHVRIPARYPPRERLTRVRHGIENGSGYAEAEAPVTGADVEHPGVTPDWWWSTALSAAVSTTIAVLGWGIVYRLGIKAQREQFRRQLLNTARLEIKTSLTDAADGLRGVMLAAVRANEAVVRAQHGDGGGTIAAVNLLVNEFGRWTPTEAWARLLDDYEVFFPGIAPIRDRLRSQYRLAVRELRRLEDQIERRAQEISAVGTGTEEQYAKTMSPAFRAIHSLVVPSGVHRQMEALRVFVQNEGLAEVTGARGGAKPPLDEPGSAEVIRLPNGQLEFVTRLGDPPPPWTKP